jgi:uncharacterized protein
MSELNPPTAAGPSFRTLTRAECEALLARNHVGRIAYSFHDHVDIEPIHYVFRNGVVNCRTSYGSKLMSLAHHPYAAFEVDEVQGLWDWRSVVAKGPVYVAAPEGSPTDRQAYREALDALQTLVPETFRADDPAEFRTVVFRLYVDQISGRQATPQ